MSPEPLVDGSQRYLLHKRVFGLSVACPFDHGNPGACPLHEVRKMGVMERFEWLHEQSEEGMRNLLVFHQKCLEEKEKIKKIRPQLHFAVRG
jgi:hypothetical protein